MTKIGCAGMLVVDTFCGPMASLPRAGQLLALDDMPVKAGGCAANVAIDLAKQGFAVDVIGCLGRDAEATAQINCLKGHGVGCEQVRLVEGFPSSKTVILLVDGEDRRYLHVFGSNRAFGMSHVDRAWLKTLSAFYLGGLCALPGVVISELIETLRFCREQGVKTVVDVVIPQTWSGQDELKQLLPHADYFLPNQDEAERITGCREVFEQLRFFREAGGRCVIITQGKDGVVAATGDRFWRCRAYPAACVDPSGSGDAFSAGVLTGIARGWKMRQILRYGSALGASATRAVGTTDGVFGPDEANAFISSHQISETSGTF